MEHLACFKAYDIRGRIPDELNDDLAWRIGRACAECLAPDRVVIGHDIRLSSQDLSDSLARGFMAGGVDVYDLGLCGTEEIYFATSHLETGCGVMVTASHNPADYNGMKIVRENSKPVSGNTGLKEIEALAVSGSFAAPATDEGTLQNIAIREAFIDHLLTHVDITKMKPLKIVINGGNGCAGPLLEQIAKRAPFHFIPVLCEPDGTFPNGVPNPLLPENRDITSKAVREHAADLGIAWDGDFDRCFLFDEKGNFIEGYYMVGLLAKAILATNPGEKIIHDPRLVWNTEKIVLENGGTPVMSRTGHALIKEKMREENCIYGGEMSAHHYFRDFFYCDSGMIPWLLVCEIMSRENTPLSAMVSEMIENFPVSGEINNKVQNPDRVIATIEKLYAEQDGTTDYTDGYSFTADRYRFNIRKSNTEPVLRLNVESRGDRGLTEKKTEELLAIITST